MTTFFHLKSRLVDGRAAIKCENERFSFEITIGFFLPNKSVFFDGLHTVHPVIVSFARGVLGVKITKNICDESASHRKGVVKIDPRNSIPS